MITLRGVTYHYPHRSEAALEQVDWRVNDGEFVLVAGPSGSGKSTLLRCLNGLVPHFSGGVYTGETEVDGVNVVEAGPHVLSRLVGFVAQDPESQAVFDQVENEIAFSLENAAIPATEMRVRVEEVLDLLDLAPLRRRAVQTLSGVSGNGWQSPQRWLCGRVCLFSTSLPANSIRSRPRMSCAPSFASTKIWDLP